MSPTQRSYRNEPIAVIGSGHRFPGEANTPSKLWDLLREPRDVQSAIPEDRFNPHGFYHPVNDHHGTSNIRHSYFLTEDPRLFDATFFGIKPVEANSIDPQQRLLLEVVYEAIEAAGLSMDALRGSPTAVYVGLMCADYADLLGRDTGDFPTYFATGTARSIISNRVSYFFDWRGPSMTIDTACSSSLVAVHQAVQTLRAGEARVAVAAGANLLLGPEQYIAESNLKMLSPSGRSHMWSEKADGYARGEGIAGVVLKTLSAALEDGDDIECLIVETGINQDGKTKGITMPSATAQAALIEATYKKAGLDLKKTSDRPQYFEAHGTGTPAGDPIEAEAITTAFFTRNYPDTIEHPLFVGSIKTVVGHTEGTAGLAGLLKASLALKHATIPPNMLFEKLAPTVKPFYNNLEIATKAKPWPQTVNNGPRRASLNSFGFGGANAHCILESYSPLERNQEKAEEELPVYTPFAFSAVSEKALTAVVASYADFIKNDTDVNLRALSRTLSDRRNAFPNRVTISARNASSLLTKLEMFVEGNGEKPIVPVATSGSSLRVLGIFTGQGAQWAGMASKLMDSPAVLSMVDDLERSLSELPDHPPAWSLKAELLANKSVSRIGEAALSQPACTAVQIILVNLLRAAGITFSAVVGHSSGEIGAAYAAGYLTASDAIRIAYYRGVHLRLAQGKKEEAGAMIAVGTSYEDAKSFCNLRRFRGKVVVAASNSSTSVTLSGDATAIENVRAVFEDEQKFVRVLRVDKAYHSHHMNACSEAYMNSLRAAGIKAHRPAYPDCLWVSSVYGQDIADVQDSLNDSYWNSNLVSPVLFSQALEYALGEAKFDYAIECGPHPALKGPASQVIQEAIGETIPYTGLLSRNMDDVEAFANGLGYIWATMGESAVNLAGYDRLLNNNAPSPRLLKGLPTYPWEHQRAFWHESRISKTFRTRSTVHELLGVRAANHSDDQVSWTNRLVPRELPWIPGHRIQGQMVFPAAGYISTAFEAARQISSEENMQRIELTNFTIGQPVVFDTEDSSVEVFITLSDIRRQGGTLRAKFSYYSTASKEPGPMSLNAGGGMEITYGRPEASALRPLPEPEFAMMEVTQDRFYDSFAQYGYGYTGPFRALTSMERKLGVATGSIDVPEDSSAQRLMIHPAPLDAAIQSILLAYCFPGDGRLVSIQLPTDVSSIIINPAQALNGETAQSLKFVSSISHDDGKRIEGDVDLYPADGSNALVQLEGLHTKPMVPPTESNDLQIFSETIWDSATPNAMVVSAEDDDGSFEFGFTLERVAYYYLRNLVNGTTSADRRDCEWYHKSLFNFADTMLSRVANGTHPYAKTEWINDTYDDILPIIESHPESIDLRIMRAVGENIIRVVKGETTILEPMRQDNMLNDFYVLGLGMKEYLAKLTATAKQISHRHPAMNVLEIGAGTGGATKSILRELDEAFASYTYTDISSGFAESAQEVFKGREHKLIYKTLDIEKDVVEQGYSEHSYDLIIASLVLHATTNMDDTMRNVRRLLKPGGYLLMLEITDNEQIRFGFIFGGLPGWWLGHEDTRPLSPCVEAPVWDTLLKNSGFSGIDTMAPHKTTEPLPLCVMLAQAVDDRISFLRSPLSSSATEGVNLSQLSIIGGSTSNTSSCLSTTANLLRPHFAEISQVASLVELVDFDLPFGGTVVCFQDHDASTFENMTAEKLKGLQALFEKSKNIAWITRGYKQGSPFAKMIVAFARCLVLEMSHVRVQFLDFPNSEELNPQLISEALLRFLVADQWEDQGRLKGIFWSVEPEISHENGQDYIPRIKLSKALNTRYNSARRQITQAVEPAKVPVSLLYENDAFILKAKSGLAQIEKSMQPDDVHIRVRHSILQTVRVGTLGYFYLVLGNVVGSGAQVIALSTTSSTEITVRHGLIRPCLLPEQQAIERLVATFYSLIAHTALTDLVRGDAIVVVEPDEPFAAALESSAAIRGIQTQFLTSEQSPVKRESCRVIRQHASKREVLSVIKADVSRILCWEDNEWTSTICKHLGNGVPVETLKAYTAFAASQVPSSKALRASEILDQAQMSLFSAASEVNSKNITTKSIANIGELTTSGSTVTVIDWATSSTVPMELEPVDARPLFRNDKSYWLVGLTGGLGLSLCRWMISRGARHIAISSRNPKVDSRWVKQFEAMSATVEVYANDVTDRAAVQETYDKIQRDLPPIAGVCHGAMVLQDTLLLALNMQRMEQVLKPKVNGAKYLDEIFSYQPLEFFVMLSSMAAVTGNAGQAAYAAANMFIAGLAAQRRQRGVAASTVNIGAIIGNGYVTRELTLAQQMALQKGGNMWMSEQDFHQIFAEAVVASPARPGPNPEYCTGLRVYYADEEDKPNFAKDPVFSHLMLHRTLAGPTSSDSSTTVSVKTQLLQARSLEEVYAIIQGSLELKLQAALQISPDTDVLSLTADALGIDSLVAVDLRSWFLKELGVDMPVLKIISGATIGELLDRAQELLDPDMTPALGTEASADQSAAAATAKPAVKESSTKTMSKPTTSTAKSDAGAPATKPKEAASKAQHELAASKAKQLPAPPETINTSTPDPAPVVNILERVVQLPVSKPEAPNASLTPRTQAPTSITATQSAAQEASQDSKLAVTKESLIPAVDLATSTLADKNSGYLSDDPGPDSASSDLEIAVRSIQTLSTSVSTDDNSGSHSLVASSNASVSSFENTPPASVKESGVQKLVPMSFGQARFWFLRSYLEDPTTFNVTASIHLQGALRVDDLVQAVATIGQRHESLRTRFFTDAGNQPMQAVLESSVLGLERKKVSSEEDIKNEYARLCAHVYDLEKAETLRIILLELSPVSHQILLGYHHINMDGVSFEIFFSDLEQAYNSSPAINAPVLQYPDFAVRQRQDFADGNWGSELSYWKKEFPNLPAPLPLLPLSRSSARASLAKYNSHLTSFRVTNEMSARINDTCKKMKVSPFQFYLTVYKVLITRYLDVDDFCIGVADANRNDPDQQKGLGCYLNLLPIRFDNHAASFSEAVKETKTKAQLAYANSKVPFDVLLTELNVPRSSHHAPLFQVFLNYRQRVAEKRTFAGCESEWTDFDGGRIAYDLSLDVVDNAGGNALLRLFSQTELYSAEDTEVLMKSFVNLLDAFSRNPATRLTRPALYHEDDTQKALTVGRGPGFPLQWEGTLAHRIDEMAGSHKECTALKDGTGNELTYQQMSKRVNDIAFALSDAQVGQGSHVGVFQDASTDWICSLLAIMRIGAVYIPLDPRASTTRLATMVEDCNPIAVLIDDVVESQVPELKSSGKMINVSKIRSSSGVVPNVSTADSIMTILYTSGSTGKPKGIEMKHAIFRDHTETVTKEWIPKIKDPAALQQSSFNFDMSLVQVLWPLCSGGRLIIAPQSARGDPVAISQIISSEKISITAATPSEYSGWIEYGNAEGLRASGWSLAISGGEKITDSLVQEFGKLNIPDFRLMNCYGPTEATFFTHFAEVDFASNNKSQFDLKPWFNVSSYVVDSNLNPLPIGVPGELALGGMGVASGYFKHAELSEERFIRDSHATQSHLDNGWNVMHLTGDRARFTADGSLLLEGRVAGDTQIKLRGLRIDLQEIETAIVQNSHGTILHAIVDVRQPADGAPEMLVGHVEFSSTKKPANVSTYVVDLLNGLPLPQYMRPSLVLPVDELPRTNSGKLDRRAIKTLPLPRKLQPQSDSTNLGDTESRLLQLWKDVLTQEIFDNYTIDSSSDFFQVGGTSLLLVDLRARIQKTFSLDIPLVQLFDVSTLGRMAAKIHGPVTLEAGVEPIKETPPSTQPARVEPAPASIAKEVIDWESETALSTALVPSTVLGTNEPRVVIMTGATGFLGKAILQRLITSPSIEKIYCIAIRPDHSQLDEAFSSSKVTVYKGDQSLPLLGLPPATITPMLTEADAVIHNGADVSFLKSYTSLRRVNVDSTKQLANWAVEFGLQFHYISTSSVANLTGRASYPAQSVRAFPPATDGSNGYIASKWASETYLERLSQEYLLPLVIHRPSSITGPGVPDTDVMGSLFKYSRQMLAIPAATGQLQGTIDLVSLGSAADKIVRTVRRGQQELSVQYVYESGEVQVASDGMKASMDQQVPGETIQELPMEEWVRRAEVLGMNGMVAAFLLGMKDQPLLMTKPDVEMDEDDVESASV